MSKSKIAVHKYLPYKHVQKEKLGLMPGPYPPECRANLGTQIGPAHANLQLSSTYKTSHVA